MSSHPWSVTKADFIAGAEVPESLPPAEFPEIAFLGRSNVGKSSLINRLCQRRALARVSSTPGRTQQINLFHISIKNIRGSVDFSPWDLSLVDLPGFGYAKLSREQRRDMSRETINYLRGREGLKVVCLLVDVRRLGERDEHAIQAVCAESDRRVVVVATKVDTLKRSEVSRTVTNMAKSMGLAADDIIVSGEKIDCRELWERLRAVAEL